MSSPSRAPWEHVLPPAGFRCACRTLQILPARFLVVVSVLRQKAWLLERSIPPHYHVRGIYLVSTSKLGVGQLNGSNKTPAGLHRIAEKIGAGYPVGTVFASRKPAGYTWQQEPSAPIAHRILRLDGLEPGLNRGANVDSYARYIYMHGVGDESNLGRPSSQGCIHIAAKDLLPLFDLLPVGTMVWIDPAKQIFSKTHGSRHTSIGCGFAALGDIWLRTMPM
jgi:hypothetical protein